MGPLPGTVLGAGDGSDSALALREQDIRWDDGHIE